MKKKLPSEKYRRFDFSIQCFFFWHYHLFIASSLLRTEHNNDKNLIDQLVTINI